MVCPECGEHLYRSHTRGFKEWLIRTFTSYRAYRCRRCGWRAMAAPNKKLSSRGFIGSLLLWIAGLIVALLVGSYAIYEMRSSINLPASGKTR